MAEGQRRQGIAVHQFLTASSHCSPWCSLNTASPRLSPPRPPMHPVGSVFSFLPAHSRSPKRFRRESLPAEFMSDEDFAKHFTPNYL